IPDDERQEAHVRIGRLLAARAPEDPEGAALLEIVTHLNLGADRIHAREERMKLARWDLLAGRQVKATSAYEAAARYLPAGAKLRDEAAWRDAPKVAFALHMERAECEHLSGHLEEALRQHEALLDLASTDLERASVHTARVALHITLGRYDAALAAGM